MKTGAYYLIAVSLHQPRSAEAYSVKNFNTYVSNQNEESLIIAGKHKVNARYITGLETYIQPYDEVVPAAFLSSTTTNNEPFALGGEDNTISHMTAVCFAENTYQLDGILSVFADASKEVFAWNSLQWIRL